jgi:hypothetical protein
MEEIKDFIVSISTLSFWERLFSWRKVKTASQKLQVELKYLEQNLTDANQRIIQLENDLKVMATKTEANEANHAQIKDAKIKAETELQQSLTTISSLQNKVNAFEFKKEQQQIEYDQKVNSLNNLKDSMEKDKVKIHDDREAEIHQKYDMMKKTWAIHEQETKEAILGICQKHIIDYVEKFPHKGTPDNVVNIMNEYIVFDAKSPANDNLDNFPTYIKAQVEQVKKYAKLDDVRKEIFLVVPSNTIDLLPIKTYKTPDYTVYIITKDSLEPVLLSLKKIEEYEFAEQLSPEERINICRVIGKFAHTTKRKIQIDQFFTMQFLDILSKCKNELPKDILEQVIEFEKASTLNPPTEKKAKQIITQDLRSENDQLNAKAGFEKIEIPETLDEVKKLN